MAEAAAAPPPLETKVGYSADGKRVVLKCSMCVPDICSAPSKRAYTRNKKGKLLWQAEIGCYYCSRCLAHAAGHATRIADASRRAMIGLSEEAAEAAAAARRRDALGGGGEPESKWQRPTPSEVSEVEPRPSRKNSAAAGPHTAAKPARSRRKIETLSDTEAKEQCRRHAAEIKALERKLDKRDLTVAKLRAEASELKKAPKKLQAKLDAVCDTVEWRTGQLLKEQGLPDTPALLAESLLDGRLPTRSIPWLKIQAIAVNIRQNNTKHFRYSDDLMQLVSQATKCEGSAAAIQFLRGPNSTGKGKKGTRFVDVVSSRSNDPSIPGRSAYRSWEKKRIWVPISGIIDQVVDTCVTYLQSLGLACEPPPDPHVQVAHYTQVGVLLIDIHSPDTCLTVTRPPIQPSYKNFR